MLTEIGFADKLGFTFDEFVEVWRTFPLIRLADCADFLQIYGELRDIVFSPGPGTLMPEKFAPWCAWISWIAHGGRGSPLRRVVAVSALGSPELW